MLFALFTRAMPAASSGAGGVVRRRGQADCKAQSLDGAT